MKRRAARRPNPKVRAPLRAPIVEGDARGTARHFRTLVERTPDAMLVHDVDGILLFANAALARLLRAPRAADLIGRRLWDFTDAGDHAAIRDRVAKVAHGETVAPVERSFRRLDGTRVQAEAVAAAIDFDGRLAMQVVLRDLTERKRAQEEQRRFRLALDNSADMIVLIDRATMRFVDVNRTACDLLGYSRDELLAMGPQDLLPVSRQELERSYDELIANPSLKSGMKTHYRCKDGALLPFESTRRVLRSGDTYIIAAIARDIRERIAAEQALRESEEKYRAILESILEPYYEVDLKGNLALVNTAFCRLLGYSKRELAGMNNRHYQTPEVAARVYKTFNEVYRNGVPAIAYDWEMVRKDGSKVLVEGSVNVIKDAHGQPVGFRGMLRDVTARRQVEQALRESEERFRGLSELASDWFWEIDQHYRFSSMSERVSSVTGLLPDNYVGKCRWEIPGLTPDGGDWEGHRRALEARQPFRDFAVTQARADGTRGHILVSGQPVFDPAGRFHGYRGTAKDVTQRHRDEEDLRRFRAAMDMSLDAIYLTDRTTMRFVDVNEAACLKWGYTRRQLLEMGPQDLFPTDREELERSFDEVITMGASGMRTESSYRAADGGTRWNELQRRALRSGERWIIVTNSRDITELKQAEQALRDGATQLRMFADNVPAMTVVYDENLRCLFANRRFAEFFSLTVTSIVGKHLREIIGEEVYQEIKVHFDRVLQGYPTTYERTRRLANGESRHLEVKLIPHLRDEGKIRGLFAVTSDITERKEEEERIRRLAHHDRLTGLPNRLLFDDLLRQAISLAKRDSRKLALLYVDLDRFKFVNDTLGHDAGDELLKSAAERMRRQVRESDTVARIGGDEFAVILPAIENREDGATVAGKIIDALRAPFDLRRDARSVVIGTSIGIAIYPADAQDLEALVKVADAAMYKAKRAGNCFRFFEADKP